MVGLEESQPPGLLRTHLLVLQSGSAQSISGSPSLLMPSVQSVSVRLPPSHVQPWPQGSPVQDTVSAQSMPFFPSSSTPLAQLPSTYGNTGLHVPWR